MASAAAKAVWGENQATREPVSGAQGDVARGEPYDAGNLETPQQEKVEDRLSSGALESMPATRPAENGTMESAEYTKTENQPSKENEDGLLTQEELKAAGPGPRPLEVVAKENGGTAVSSGPESSRKENTLGETPSAENTLETSNTDTSAHSEPVHATGLAADGGDFDATKPGAGADADRLMEQKGMNRECGESSSPTRGKDKPSLGERIKAKLHRH
ncbi:glycine-rich cell wall structural protein 1 [Stachybotrys elegans]|uniref:Glycine-rich cell wall structural protein 1 n=1 Tax=Stachybotrys elegans TaxID=80388 RepID=A0A8K0WP00_9HYPO|nr:glycine-rich cell wall structural protein 1 [Stachybotrys elegans]